LLADRNRMAEDGEHSIVWVKNWIDVARRWKNFEAFLREAIQDTEADVKETQARPRPSRRASARGAKIAGDIDNALAAVERQLAARRAEIEAAKKSKR
jgi:hypothetical protein